VARIKVERRFYPSVQGKDIKRNKKKDLIPRILNSSFAKIHKYIQNKEIEKLPFLVHTKRKNRQEKEKERKENE